MIDHSDKAEIGDKIRAWDFQPDELRPDRYIEGTVLEKTERGYRVNVEKDTDAPKGVRTEILTPFSTYLDFELRIEKI
jgi:hypothetical protein